MAKFIIGVLIGFAVGATGSFYLVTPPPWQVLLVIWAATIFVCAFVYYADPDK